MVQLLGLHTFAAGGPGSIPGCGTKILKAAGSGKKINDASWLSFGWQKS